MHKRLRSNIRSNRHGPIASAIGLALLAAQLTACQSYEPLPLDLDAHHSEWAQRRPDADSVVAYAAALAAQGEPVERFAIADGLSLIEAEVVALVFNPDLRVARLRAGVPGAAAREGGRWNDPELSVDLGYIVDNVPDPWIIGGSIGFTIPLSGRPGIEQDLDRATERAEVAAAQAAEWLVRMELRRHWLEWSVTVERIAQLERMLADLADLDTLAQRLLGAGVLTRIDARVFTLELVTRQGELLIQQSTRQRLELAIREGMGLMPDAPVRLVPEPPASFEDARSPAVRRGQLRLHNPELLAAIDHYDTTEQALRLEIAKQYPDLHIGPGYENEDGQSRITLGLGLIPLPFFNANARGIAEARAARLTAHAEVEGTVERLVHALSRAEAAAVAARERRNHYERVVAPLVDEQVADARQLAELGDVDTVLLLDSVVRQHEARLSLLDARAAEAAAQIELIELVGPDQPAPAMPTVGSDAEEATHEN